MLDLYRNRACVMPKQLMNQFETIPVSGSVVAPPQKTHIGRIVEPSEEGPAERVKSALDFLSKSGNLDKDKAFVTKVLPAKGNLHRLGATFLICINVRDGSSWYIDMVPLRVTDQNQMWTRCGFSKGSEKYRAWRNKEIINFAVGDKDRDEILRKLTDCIRTVANSILHHVQNQAYHKNFTTRKMDWKKSRPGKKYRKRHRFMRRPCSNRH